MLNVAFFAFVISDIWNSKLGTGHFDLEQVCRLSYLSQLVLGDFSLKAKAKKSAPPLL